MRNTRLCTLALLTASARATYLLKDEYVGVDWLRGFDYFEYDDPTHGRVNYVGLEEAIDKNLVLVNAQSFVMRADDTTRLNSSDPRVRGRDSVRIQSKEDYGDGLFVFDVHHMPTGCGTWPAIWTVTTGNWPNGGEIDIMEGVNSAGTNQATLHTDAGCVMSPARPHTGINQQLDCDVAVNYNAGCGVEMSGKPASFGPAFNAQGGGWYVLRRNVERGEIAVWFFARNAHNVPVGIRHGLSVLMPDTWPTPDAIFLDNPGCTMSEHFGPHWIVINLTFCGDWAGASATFNSQAGCPGSCAAYVDDNPGAFSEAYFEFNSFRVYTSPFDELVDVNLLDEEDGNRELVDADLDELLGVTVDLDAE